jgi:hypothetical protein
MVIIIVFSRLQKGKILVGITFHGFTWFRVNHPVIKNTFKLSIWCSVVCVACVVSFVSPAYFLGCVQG